MLHHATVVAPSQSVGAGTAEQNVPPRSAVLFCHGILGSGGNFRTLAKQFVAKRPDLAAVLVDLRRHGQSLHMDGPDTVEACAQDLIELSSHLTLPVSGVVGHSFGGKVALAFAGLSARVPELSSLHQVVILDSTPGPRPLRHGSETTLDVLRALERAPAISGTRDTFVDALMADGVSEMLARWLAMNLVVGPSGYTFRLDLRAIRRLLDDYFATDFWPIVSSPREGLHFHLILGGKSAVFDAQDRERAARASIDHPTQVDMQTLEEAGHWVHVDDPQGTLAALLAVPW